MKTACDAGTKYLARLACAAAGLAAVALLALPDAATQSPPVRPKLAVIIVVDQMRADYVDRFKADWTAGLHRLVTRGAWFSRAAYPYLTTVTCAGHATVSTGAFPHLHGIFQNAWYDRTSGRVQTCTDDSSVEGVSYSDRSPAPESPAKLLLPTFADEMRTQRGARVATLALKARSAIMLAGHGGDAVTWISDSLDTWQTSTAFSKEPVAAVKSYLDANPMAADYGKTWTRLLQPNRYAGPDDGDAENPIRGWTRWFPHPLRGDLTDEEADRDYYEQWQRSPYADAFVGRFAAALVESLQLGRRDTTDVLGVSFSTPDLVGHAFGPRSHEVQDIYAHLDRTLGTLLERLDTLVGANQYVVALTADHGVSELPEQMRKAGQEAGRLSGTRLFDAAERVAQVAAGPGSYLARMTGNEVYFRPGMYEKLSVAPAAVDAVIRELQQQAGIARVFRREELLKGATSSDPQLRAAALSYVVGRSGDLVLSPKTGWISAAAGATHGTANSYDQRVPVILMGPGVKAGEYTGAATPADVAPSLAALVGITMPRAEGRVLREALAP